ncbi:Oidioi.mRNA.OKI2018_I69.chr2.g4531.t1.cds [Oikopleura dioica]|uniref:Cation-transporting ATPase n=1 Tax=Oikopleura dioica TaxID=34765 RepID=A0ABN7T121_OIKDI|nr:Oidioi.mRNA.OKI2018_I69.chr2.g4531.t1.cds [Oikopleura dioica]
MTGKIAPSPVSASSVSFTKDDTDFTAESYATDKCKRTLTIISYFLTAGISFLTLHWKPNWWIKCNKKRVDLLSADTIFIHEKTGSYDEYFIHSAHYWDTNKIKRHFSVENALVEVPNLLSFRHKAQRFFLTGEKTLTQVDSLQVSKTSDLTNGQEINNTEESREIFGRNEIIVKVPSVIEIFYKEVFNFFYVFQLFSVILWSIDEYLAYAMSILILTLISVVILIYNIKTNRTRLSEMVQKNNADRVTKIINGKEVSTSAGDLVPGDKIALSVGDVIPADLVLISGEVVLDEAMLTGESVPVVKLPLPAGDSYFTPDLFKNSMLSSGTIVLQTRGSVEAVVYRTGFLTTRGNLVRSILFPKPVKVKFESDAFWFVIGMFLVALLGFVYTVITHYYGCIPGGEIVVKGLDLVTISVPPALPMAMAIGSIHAQRRLVQKKIFTLTPNRINLGGGINICLFDKTGTLTEDGLNFAGVVPKGTDGRILSTEAIMMPLLALCHTLTIIKKKLSGDPLEVALFEATGWELPSSQSTNLVVKDPKSSEEWTHINTFPFTSETARQTVIAKNKATGEVKIVVKGAPEVIKGLCDETSLPENFDEVLEKFTSEGLRIIAYAQKEGSEEDAGKDRFIVEDKVNFEGFAILRNDLKPETAGVLKNLQEAGIRTLMVTGDNINTAIAVAKKCNLFDEKLEVIKPSFDSKEEYKGNRLIWRKASNEEEYVQSIDVTQSSSFTVAMTGKDLEKLLAEYPHLVESIFAKTSIFARVSPNQKAEIVAKYEDMDQIASFCGDGANDVAALKRASVGISLSELEASVAAPFTSQVADIRCVEELIKEGRCSLVTTVGMFKWIALYSFIQMITILISYWNLSNLSDWSYLYIDLFMLEPLALTFGLTAAYDTISKRIPDARLLTARTMTSTAVHILLVAIAQAAVYVYTVNQEWYCSISSDQPDCFIRDNDGDILGIYERINGDPVCERAGSCEHISLNTDMERCEDFDPEDYDYEMRNANYITQSLFYMTCFQYLFYIIIFSRGAPFRKPVFTNWILILVCIGLLAATFCLLLIDSKGIYETFAMDFTVDEESGFLSANATGDIYYPPIPTIGDDFYGGFRWILVVIAAIQIVIAYFFEEVFISRDWLWNFVKRCQRKRHKGKRFRRIDEDVAAAKNWPYLTEKNETKI